MGIQFSVRILFTNLGKECVDVNLQQNHAKKWKGDIVRMMMNVEKGALVEGKLKFFFIVIAFLGKEFTPLQNEINFKSQ